MFSRVSPVRAPTPPPSISTAPTTRGVAGVLDRVGFIRSILPSPLERVWSRPDETLFDPRTPDETIYDRFRGRVFRLMNEGSQTDVFACEGYVIKVPLVTISLTAEDHETLYEQPLVGGLFKFLNQLAEDWLLWKALKKGVKLAIHQVRPQVIRNPEVHLKGYRTGLEHLGGLIVPYRILRRDRFYLRGRLLEPKRAQWPDQVIFQMRVRNRLLERLQQALNQGQREVAFRILENAVRLQGEYWSRGVADLDCGFNIFENLAVEPDESVRLIDAGYVSDDREAAVAFFTSLANEARSILDDIEGGKTLATLTAEWKRQNLHRQGAMTGRLVWLQRRLTPQAYAQLGTELLRLVASDLNGEAVRESWGPSPIQTSPSPPPL